MGELQRVESLDSSKTLDRLTGVLGRRSGVLGGVLDFRGGVSSSLGVGVVDWAAGLTWVYGTAIYVSNLRCMNVHIDMKSSSWVWLIFLGIDGKMRPLTSDDKDE